MVADQAHSQHAFMCPSVGESRSAHCWSYQMLHTLHALCGCRFLYWQIPAPLWGCTPSKYPTPRSFFSHYRVVVKSHLLRPKGISRNAQWQEGKGNTNFKFVLVELVHVLPFDELTDNCPANNVQHFLFGCEAFHHSLREYYQFQFIQLIELLISIGNAFVSYDRWRPGMDGLVSVCPSVCLSACPIPLPA